MVPALDDGKERPRRPVISRIRAAISANFELVFTLAVLASVMFIYNFCDNKSSVLDLYFVLVVLCGYFLNTRSAVLGSVMAILVVGFFVLLNPSTFADRAPDPAFYAHLLLWSSCLVLTAALVAAMNEQLRGQFGRAWRTLERFNEIQEDMLTRQRSLEEQNRVLVSEKSRLESVLYYAMDPNVAQMIIQNRLENENREITVLFADLEAFTANAEGMPPEIVVRNLNQLFGQMEPILSRFHGHLDKYIGDGLMAEFGAPFFTRRHALLGVCAALRMQEHMRNKDFPWKMRIGLANGSSLVGLVGSEHRKNYTAVGDVVNLAARIQNLCPPGGVCVDRNTYQLIARWCHARPLRPPLSKQDVELFERVQSSDDDPARKELLEEAMVKAFLHEEEGYVAIKGKKEQIAIYEILGINDGLDNYLRVPREAADLYHRLRPSVLLPEDELLTLEAIEGAIGHGRVTAALSVALGQRLGLDEQEQRELLLAAHLHDIGKLAQPTALIEDPRVMKELSPAEQEQMRSHPAQAETILRQMNAPLGEKMLDAIRQHHERFDGGGYPEGLKGNQISLMARIVQIADEYEALTSPRAYRERFDLDAAIDTLRADIEGGKFDPKIGAAFIELISSTLA